MVAAVTDKEVPEGIEEYIVPKSKWAIFERNGPVQIEMTKVWCGIFDECFPYEGARDNPNYKFEESLIAPPYYWGINHCTGSFKYFEGYLA